MPATALNVNTLANKCAANRATNFETIDPTVVVGNSLVLRDWGGFHRLVDCEVRGGDDVGGRGARDQGLQ